MLMSFPLLFYEPRNILLYFVVCVFKSSRSQGLHQESLLKQSVSMKIDKIEEETIEVIDPTKELKPLLKNSLIIGLLVLCIFSAIIIPNIKSVFSIVGVTAGNLISFILPSSFYLKITNRLKTRKNKFLRVMAYVSLCFGILSLIIGLVGNAIDFI